MADHFPQTLTPTWWSKRLADGDRGRLEINAHIFEVYRKPLMIYFSGFPDSKFVEADEAVNGFLARRLDDPEFFQRWRKSGRRLREWLMTSFRFHVLEERHGRQRDARVQPLPGDPQPDDAPPPDVRVMRAFRNEIIGRALADTEAWCLDRDMDVYFQIFKGHVHDRRPYADLGAQHGVTDRRAAVMCRTVKERYIGFLKAILAHPDDFDGEIRDLLDN